MNKFKRYLNLSIFGRTFLLMVAALIIAEGIGIALIVKRPPSHNHPVSINELARRLDDSGQFAGDPPPFGPPPEFSPNRSMPGFPPPADMVNFREKNDSELHMSTVSTPPIEPAKIDHIASEMVRNRLSELLRVDPNTLVVFIKKNTNFFDMPPLFGENFLTEGFIAAKQLRDGSWRIVENVAQPFPNAFQIQALTLFVFGLLCLIPLAWLFSRALSVPIMNFSRAAKRIGTDPGAAPLPVEGPKEIYAAIESFNAMQERLNGLLRERTEMIAAIAHDLRTPLTRLAFRLDDLPSPLHEKVNADIQEMKTMISLALDFIRDRSQGIRRERLDFRLLVESVVDDLNDLGHDVIFAESPSVILEGDPLALRRVVMNVVDNAIKYGEQARLQLTIAQEFCTLDIDDNGPGINEALQKRVFEPFFRVESSRNRDTGGVGLGLAVVRAIINEHAGEIQLRNRSPKGLRVTIKLPLIH